ncbi:MAG: hypothetical protein Q8K99_05325 [Actinomycetota bacterium]|nr:hypothetical protein [Actinomycetota bacterium]
MIAAAAFTLATLALGWIALAPLARRLGAAGYHAVAYPVGLLGWSAVACVSAVVRHACTWQIALAGAAVFSGAGLALTQAMGAPRGSGPRAAGGPGAPSAPAAWTFAATGGALAAVAAALAASGWTSAAFDSIFHYQSSAMWLFDTGRFTPNIVGAYSPLIPSILAAGRLFGLDWVSTVWPLLALHVAVWVAAETYGAVSRTLLPAARTALAAIITLLLVTTAPFLAHTLYVHSHMISACYLLLAVLAVRRAFWPASAPAATPRPAPAPTSAPSALAARAWLVVAGVATAGLVLARPDGLAYAFAVLVLVAIAGFERTGTTPATILAYLAALLAPVAAVYGTALLRLGLWRGPKLSGNMTAALIIGLAAAGIATVAAAAIAERAPRARAVIGRKGLLLGLALTANAAAIAVMAARNPAGFAAATSNMIGNLTRSGGYGNLWLVAAALVALSLATWSLWAHWRWPVLHLYAIAQFFAVAVVVHGTSHTGRLSPADSFARVAFHAVPLVFVYAGYVVGGLLDTCRKGRDAESA